MGCLRPVQSRRPSAMPLRRQQSTEMVAVSNCQSGRIQVGRVFCVVADPMEGGRRPPSAKASPLKHASQTWPAAARHGPAVARVDAAQRPTHVGVGAPKDSTPQRVRGRGHGHTRADAPAVPAHQCGSSLDTPRNAAPPHNKHTRKAALALACRLATCCCPVDARLILGTVAASASCTTLS